MIENTWRKGRNPSINSILQSGIGRKIGVVLLAFSVNAVALFEVVNMPARSHDAFRARIFDATTVLLHHLPAAEQGDGGAKFSSPVQSVKMDFAERLFLTEAHTDALDQADLAKRLKIQDERPPWNVSNMHNHCQSGFPLERSLFMALKQGGHIGLQLSTLPNGRVSGASVIDSSGNALLDLRVAKELGTCLKGLRLTSQYEATPPQVDFAWRIADEVTPGDNVSLNRKNKYVWHTFGVQDPRFTTFIL